MSLLDVKVPSLGVEGAMEVIEICVTVGDELNQDDAIIVLESDKTTVEVPCSASGRVDAINVSVGDKIIEGESVLILSSTEVSAGERESSSTEEEELQVEEKQFTGGEPEGDITNNVSLQNILVPDLGGAEQVEVIEILVKENQMLTQDDTLIVLESDKTTMEIPSTFSGELKELMVKLGDKVSSGDRIATVLGENEATNSESSSAFAGMKVAAEADVPMPKEVKEETVPTAIASEIKRSNVHAGPAVRRFARELGVDIGRVEGSGPKARILKEDLNAYIKQQVTLAQGSPQASGANFSGNALPRVPLPDFSAFGDVDVTAMEKIQRITAENMQASWLTVPHVTQFDEADITAMESFRKDQKKLGEIKGIKLTPMAFLLKACAYALRQLPQFNVSIDMEGHKVYSKKYINIGIAVDTPNGLVVPVIRDVDKKGLWDLAEECQMLAAKARDRKLKPADMQGGCFTISSLGSLGGTAFTPIVNTPEVAILGVSKAQLKPSYDAESKCFMPRLMLPLSLSYDHRAVNGADGARFTSLLSDSLGDLRTLLL